MIKTTFAARLRALSRSGRERGSIAMLMMVTLVGVMLAGIMIPIVVNQDQSTDFESSRVESLDAAQSGIDVVVGQIRNAVNGTGAGQDAQLPCGPFTGNAFTGSTATYYAEVLYYTADPIANTSASPMICANGYGPYDPTLATRTPSYACIISTGVYNGTLSTSTSTTNTSCANAVGAKQQGSNTTSSGRTLVTTYVFETSDNNVAGGVIRIFPDSSGNSYCMDAGSASPAVGTAVTLQPCSTSNPAAQQQTFAYRSDLSIVLVSSITSTSAGLCLDSKTPHAAGNPIFLNTCSALGSAPTNQEWSIDDNSHLEGSLSDGSNIDGYCITVANQAANVPLLLQTCTGGTTDTSQTWVPSPSAGAGADGGTNGQLVNFELFGNCLDVTGQDPTSSFMILYTCKQNPNTSKLTWNQLFSTNPTTSMDPTQTADSTVKPAAAELVTNDTANSTRYCLLSPMTVGGYVTVGSGSTNCPSSVPAGSNAARWTIYRLKDSSGNELPYNMRYTIVDSAGLCLGLGPNSDLYTGVYEKIIVTNCDGSTSQKWNANPSTGKSSFQNTMEEH